MLLNSIFSCYNFLASEYPYHSNDHKATLSGAKLSSQCEYHSQVCFVCVSSERNSLKCFVKSVEEGNRVICLSGSCSMLSGVTVLHNAEREKLEKYDTISGK